MGIMEMRFAAFENPETEVPFHRIRFFRDDRNGIILWDRTERIDLITAGYMDRATANSHDEATSSGSDNDSAAPSQRKKLSQSQKRELLKQRRLQKRIKERDQLIAEEREIFETEEEQARHLDALLGMAERAHERVIPRHDAEVFRPAPFIEDYE